MNIDSQRKKEQEKWICKGDQKHREFEKAIWI
jgi:hypothetical protein